MIEDYSHYQPAGCGIRRGIEVLTVSSSCIPCNLHKSNNGEECHEDTEDNGCDHLWLESGAHNE